MQSLLIRNARMVNEGQVREGDLLVRHGRIERIAGCLENCGASREIDAAGRYLLPGMIDDQVHFREPGYPQKGSIASESRAAVAGGITSFMDMPNTRPATLSLEALAEKKRLAAAHSVANFGFHFGVSRDNLDTVAALDPREVAAVKVFMGASTGDMLVDDLPTLERLFASVPTLLLSHCEDTPRIEANLARWRQRFGERIPAAAHPRIRDAEACYRSTALAVELAQRHGTLLHVLHLSTARELALFEDKPLCQKRITAEVCVHHLLFDDSDYARLGHLLKCNPAIKSREDRDACAGAGRNRLDVIGTDHAPHAWAEKQQAYPQRRPACHWSSMRCRHSWSWSAKAGCRLPPWWRRPATGSPNCSPSPIAVSSAKVTGPTWCWSANWSTRRWPAPCRCCRAATGRRSATGHSTIGSIPPSSPGNSPGTRDACPTIARDCPCGFPAEVLSTACCGYPLAHGPSAGLSPPRQGRHRSPPRDRPSPASARRSRPPPRSSPCG